MKLSDLIEEYIRDCIKDTNELELRRSDLSRMFNCVPSQINYVISTRFVPEMGFYVESRRGGGGYIKIIKKDMSDESELATLIDKIGNKLSQSVVDVYLKDFVSYNILDEDKAKMIKVAVSNKSLEKVDKLIRNDVRADIFKNLIINILN